MKPKKIGKKLVLNKETISHLTQKEISVVHGGDNGLSDYETCKSLLSYCFTQCVTNCVYQTKMCCLSNGCTIVATLCSCPGPCDTVTTCP
jgi:hypothetical protein